MLNQNTKRDPGIKCALFNSKEEKGMDNFGYLNSLYYFTFIFYRTCKKLFAVCTLTAEHSLPHIRASILLAGTPLLRLSTCTFWMTPWDNH